MSPAQKLDEVRRLEHLAFRGWPALDTRDIGGWRLRRSGGYTKRSNSINAIGPEFSTNIEALEAPYRERGQSPVWRLTPLAPLEMEARLAERGYRAIERSLLQVCPLHDRFEADAD